MTVQTALVTGATAGLGRELAEQLAAKGCGLVLVARTAGRLEEAAAEIRARHGVPVEVLVADLGDREDLGRVADRVGSAERPVHVLVNNAGFGLGTPFVATDLADEERLLDVLVRAPLVLSHTAARAMVGRGSGRIVNVSSVAGFMASGSYAAAKSYLTVLTESLAGQLVGTGVTSTVACPGYVRTEFHERAGIDKGARSGPFWLDASRVVGEVLDDAAAGKVVSVPSRRYALVVQALRHLPRRVLRSGPVVRAHRRRRGEREASPWVSRRSADWVRDHL